MPERAKDSGTSKVHANVRNSKNVITTTGDAEMIVVEGANTITGELIDADKLRAALHDVYEALNVPSIPLETKIATQTAVGNALNGVTDEKVDGETIESNLKEAGAALKAANATIEEGSALWKNVQTLANVIGPAVAGGARIVAQWFGISL